VHRLLLAWLVDALKNGCLSFDTVVVDALPPLFYVGVDVRSGDLVKEGLHTRKEYARPEHVTLQIDKAGDEVENLRMEVQIA
jgi:hypothetical protein